MKHFKKLSISAISFMLMLLISFTLPIQVMAETVSSATPDEVYTETPSTIDEEESDQGNIIGENTALRDEYTKYFITDAGTTIAAQYAVPVHYKDDNGEYVNYDNSLTTSQALNSEATADEATSDEISTYNLRTTEELEEAFTNKKSNSKVSHFKKSGKAKLIEITRDSHTISWGYSGANIVEAQEQNSTKELIGNDAYLTLTNLSSTVIYENIYNNIDLEVINSTTGVKENLILKSSNTKNVFKIEYSIGDLIAESADSQTIELKDNSGKVVYTISAPYMKDANGETSEALELKILSNNKGKLSVKLTADKTWLKDKSRAYPVTVDPSFQYGQDWGVVESTFINENAPSDSYGVGGTNYQGSIYVGRPDADSKLRRSLIKIVDPETSIPLKNGDMIVNAQIALAQVTDDLTETIYVGAYEATSSWSQSTATWSNAPTCSSVLIDYEKIPANTQEWRYWDVTELVKKWYNGDTNNGLYLKALNESSVGQGLQFTSASNPEDKDYRPCFVLTYRNNKGVEGYWSYTTIDCGRAGTAYINDYSGNLVFEMPLASTASPIMAAGLGYIYNSYYAGQKYMDSYPYTGRGWKMNIQQTLYETSDDLLGDNQDDYPYVYTDADGTEHYICPKVEDDVTKYYDEDGLNLELQIPETNYTYYYLIVNEDNEKFHFNQDGLLSKMENKSGQSVTINYSGNKITSIADAEGDTITFEVNDTTNNYVEKITDSDGKVTTVTFTGSKIGGITYNDGQSVSFTYDDAGKLLSVTDVDGSKVIFAYSSHGSKGVTSVCEYGTEGTQGQKMTFDRTKYNTTVIQTSGTDGVFNNTNDIITTCQFDNLGKLTSTYSKSYDGSYLSASDATYTSGTLNSDASNIKTVNKVSQAYTVGANTENLLKNHNMESTSNWTSAAWGSGTVEFTASANDTDANVLYGQKSMGMTVTSVTNDARGRIYQNIDEVYLEPGASYTLSCYVKVTDITPIAENDVYGAVICVTPFFDDGSSRNIYSDHISKATDTEINKGFRRLSVTFTVPTDTNFNFLRINLGIHSAIGTAYFDGVQLEKASAAGHYNMLENSSFERSGPESWSETNTVDKDGRCTTAMDGSASLYISADVSTAKNFHQDVIINGTEADTYILSGWGYGSAVPNETNSSSFELRARVYYSDGTNVEKRSAPFNTALSDWQYASFAFNLDNGNESVGDVTPVKIRVYAISFRQGNSLCFDNLMLTKEAVPSYTYDDEGNLISVVANAEQKSNYEYTDAANNITPEDNLLTKYINPNEKEYTYTYYDDSKQIKTVTAPSGLVATYTYDAKGNANSIELSAGDLKLSESLMYSYPDKDDSKYSATVTNQRGMDSTWTYDAQDGTLLKYTDPNGNSTTYTYNTLNDTEKSIESGDQSVSYTYSSDFKHRTGITHGNTTYTFSYDEFGNAAATKVGNHTLATYKYLSNNGNLQTVYYGNGDNMSYAYDHFGNISLLVKDNKNVAKYYSNGRGDIVRYVDLVNDLEHRANYDTTSRLISKDVYTKDSNSWTRSLEYDYDNLNNIIKLSFTDSNGTHNTTHYSYDSSNRPFKSILQSGKTFRFYYDDLNRVTSKKLNTTTPVETSYTYVASLTNLETHTTNMIDTEVSNAFAYSYFYDSNGNITAIQNGTEQSDGSYIYSNSTGHKYVYDRYNQLTKHTDYDNDTVTNYTYDTNGNITKKVVESGSQETTTTYTYADSNGWGDLLTSYNGETITYDAIGNPLTYRDGITFTWQNGRELATYSDGTNDVVFRYDPSGMRTMKTIVGPKGYVRYVKYVYEGGLLLQMDYDGYVFNFSYDANGSPIGFHVKNGSYIDTYYYYGLNSRGDVEALYNSDGTLYAKYEYDAYGKPIDDNPTLPYDIATLNPLRYRGYVYDSETGLYYLQSRYYDPTTCRFINADVFYETGQGITGYNMFAYCNSNPVMYSDPTGTRIFECCPYGDCYYCKAEKKSTPSSTTLAPTDTTPSEEEHGFTYSYGVSIGGNIGPFSGSIQFGISIDTYGNIEGQWAYNTGLVTALDIGVTAGSYNMYTNAPLVNNLRNTGYQVGVGASCPIPYTYINGVAESNVVILPQDNATTYYGYSDYKGASFPPGKGMGFSLHGSGGNTQKIFSFNVFDLFWG